MPNDIKKVIFGLSVPQKAPILTVFWKCYKIVRNLAFNDFNKVLQTAAAQKIKGIILVLPEWSSYTGNSLKIGG